MTTTLRLERKYLRFSALGNALMGGAGIVSAIISSSQAIFLDAIFNLTYFLTGLFTLRVARLVAGGDDQRYPYGYAFFEPLVNGIKGVLVLGVSVMALAGAVQALLEGGRDISAGWAIGYGGFATVVCWTMALAVRHGDKETQSPLVHADAENWLVNAAISSCVLVAFAGILLLYLLDLDRFARYVDPLVVLVVVLISLSVPVRMARKALLDLLNRTPDEKIVAEVNSIVDANLTDLPVVERFVRVIQPGRQRMVMVHVVLPEKFMPSSMVQFDQVRERMLAALGNAHVATILDMLFTTDRHWGAPLSDGGSGGVEARSSKK